MYNQNPEMQNDRGTQVIFFDLDNTLYDYDKSHEAGLRRAYNNCWKESFPSDTFDLFNELYDDARIWVKKYHHDSATAHSRALYFQKLVEKKNNGFDVKLISNLIICYWNGALENMIPYEGVKDVLTKLKNLGYRLGIITNMEASIQYRKLVQLELTTQFDNIITSEEVGHEKPHPLIYSHSLNIFNIDPKYTWMVGDSFKNDIEAAIWMGMNAVWFNPNKFPKPKNADRINFYEIKSFSDLIPLIQKEKKLKTLECD